MATASGSARAPRKVSTPSGGGRIWDALATALAEAAVGVGVKGRGTEVPDLRVEVGAALPGGPA